MRIGDESRLIPIAQGSANRVVILIDDSVKSFA